MRNSARTAISSHLKDLVVRPLSVSYGIVAELEGHNQPPKTIAARVMAAKAVLRAVEDGTSANTALETILERTEGKVASGDVTAGALINFNFSIQGEQGVRQVGEVIQGVLASTAINNDTPAGQLTAGINPSEPSTPPINPMTITSQLTDKTGDSKD